MRDSGFIFIWIPVLAIASILMYMFFKLDMILYIGIVILVFSNIYTAILNLKKKNAFLESIRNIIGKKTSFSSLRTEKELLDELEQRLKLAEQGAALKVQNVDFDAKTESPVNNNSLAQDLCFIHIPLDLKEKWEKLLDSEWERTSGEVLAALENIRGTNEEDSQFLNQIQNESVEQQKNLQTYSSSCTKNFNLYIQKSQEIKTSFYESLSFSTSRIQETFETFDQITEVAERIKLVSLNMSIEASKVKGSNAFGFLARELRKLAEFTEETLNGIELNIGAALDTLKNNSEKQISEFNNMSETMGGMKGQMSEFMNQTSNISEYIHDMVLKLSNNQAKQKKTLINFLGLIQGMAIVKDEYSHNISFLNDLFARISDIYSLHDFARKDCLGQKCETRKALIDGLAQYMHTDGERIFYNELYKEYLGIDREKEHGGIERNGDFISF